MYEHDDEPTRKLTIASIADLIGLDILFYHIAIKFSSTPQAPYTTDLLPAYPDHKPFICTYLKFSVVPGEWTYLSLFLYDTGGAHADLDLGSYGLGNNSILLSSLTWYGGSYSGDLAYIRIMDDGNGLFIDYLNFTELE